MRIDVMNGLRRLGSAPGLRRVLLRPRVRRTVARILATRFLVAARVTTTPWKVLLGEVLRRGTHVTYTVKASGLPVAMQHGRDIEALFEIFVRCEYEPPPALRSRLQAGAVRRIFDIGANVGMFSTWALDRWPAATVVAYEPDPKNLVELRRWRTTLPNDRVEIVQAAASTSSGLLTFASGLGGGSYLSAAGDVTVPCVDIFDRLPEVDLVKMDIEGGEWPILADRRLADIDRMTLVMEYHRHGAPSLPARDAAETFLRAAGFRTGYGRPNYWGHGTLWAWKG